MLPLHAPYAPDASRRRLLIGLAAAGMAPTWAHAAADDPTGGDPLGSMQWPNVRDRTMGSEPYRFTDDVVVHGPGFAEDAMNVPISVDARALAQVGGGIERIEVVVDRNPVQHVLSFEPGRALPVIAFRFKLEQASPLRAMVRTRDGRWHVGQTWIEASGGGCTVPGATRADGSWTRTLNRVQARMFRNVLDGSGTRLRLRIMHPMDTGLVAGIPAFYIERLELRDAADQLWWRLGLHEPVSENPILTFELGERVPSQLHLSGRDNNGNRIDAEVGA